MRRLCALFLFFTILFSPSFAFALVPDDPLYGHQWYLRQIKAYGAWDISVGSRQVIVAVLDAGVDTSHPDLSANIWVNTREIPENNLDDDGNGYIDDMHGWDFVLDSNNTKPLVTDSADLSAISHGTLIAGLMGAIGNNTTGVSGVNWQISVMPLRALNEMGAGSSTAVAQAVRYAADMGADVINLSFSGDESDIALRQAVKYAYDKGVILVAALGNDGRNVNDAPVYPGCYGEAEEDWVIGVAATDLSDERAEFSNFGSSCTDLAAPGVDIFGLSYYSPTEGFEEAYEGGWAGTSMASPLVAGVAALLRAAYPDISPKDVKTVLQLSVDPLPLSAQRPQMGAGRLNAARALELGKEYSAAHPAEAGEIRYVRGASFSAVYRISESGGRRVFMNPTTYFTHEADFSTVEIVADDVLATFSLEGLMLPKAGTVLAKIQSDPRVYQLANNPQDPFAPLLREIASEEIAIAMYGENWADFVIDVEPTFFTKFGAGSRIDSPESVDTSIMLTRTQLAERSQ